MNVKDEEVGKNPLSGFTRQSDRFKSIIEKVEKEEPQDSQGSQDLQDSVKSTELEPPHFENDEEEKGDLNSKLSQLEAQLEDERRKSEDLNQRFQSLHGRLSPTQAQLAQKQLELAEKDKLITQLQGEVNKYSETAAEYKSLNADKEAERFFENTVPEDVRDMLDPATAEALKRLYAGSLKNSSAQTTQEGSKSLTREEAEEFFNAKQKEIQTNQNKEYAMQVVMDPKHGIDTLLELSRDANFGNWIDDKVHYGYLLNSFINPPSKEFVNRQVSEVRKVLEEYRATKKQGKTVEAPASPDPTPTTGGVGKHAKRRKESLVGQDMAKVLQKVKRLSRSSNMADRIEAGEILRKLKE